jgi:hypothetical protein
MWDNDERDTSTDGEEDDQEPAETSTEGENDGDDGHGEDDSDIWSLVDYARVSIKEEQDT